MRVLVCGSKGCVGRAVVRALRSRDHDVIEAARGLADGRRSLPIDFMTPTTPEVWAERLRGRGVDALVNCVGLLIPTGGQTFARVHSAGPIELFEGAALAGVDRVVQVSALGVRDDAAQPTAYQRSKLLADRALAGLPLGWSVLRPSLIYGPGSASARLFATLSSLPVVGLPGRGEQPLQPIHVYELAEIVARLLEAPAPSNAVHEIGGGDVLSYREMLATYRRSLGLGDALWLPVPAAAMRIAARLAERLPQRVLSRDTIRMLDEGSVPVVDDTAALLGRTPTAMAAGLAIGTPVPWFDLRVALAPPVAFALRASLAFMWIYTAAISLLWQQASGVVPLLARCGFTGTAGVAALLVSCTLNTGLGLATLLRPTPIVYLLQLGAIAGYTATAAYFMPALTIDHCGPLVKNLPVAMAVLVLWLAQASRPRVMSSTAANAGPATRHGRHEAGGAARPAAAH